MLHSPAYVSYPLSLFLTPSPSSTAASLPSTSFWGKFKPKSKDDPRPPPSQMALQTQRHLTLIFGDLETIQKVRTFFSSLDFPDVMYPAAEHLFCACALPCTLYLLDPLSLGIGCNRSRLDKASSRCPVHPQGSYRICITTCRRKSSY